MTFVYKFKFLPFKKMSLLAAYVTCIATLSSACVSLPLPKSGYIDRAQPSDQLPVLRRPTAGQLIRSFEMKGSKGLDYGGNLGDPVVAAAAGQVVFAASTMRGSGQMLIIKHNNLYLSTYSHNSALLVKEGDQVLPGQLIARKGDTDTDHVVLHFEVWRNGVAVNPSQFMNAEQSVIAKAMQPSAPPMPLPLPQAKPTFQPIEARQSLGELPEKKANTETLSIPSTSKSIGRPYMPSKLVADSVRIALNATVNSRTPPTPEFSDPDARLSYLRWLSRTSAKLENELPSPSARRDFLQTAWYEARRTGLDINLVLGLVKVESNFRMSTVSASHASGYMQIASSWTGAIDEDESSSLLQTQTNLRIGCIMLRHLLDAEQGNVQLALEQYISAGHGIEASDRRVLATTKRILAAGQALSNVSEAPSISSSSLRSPTVAAAASTSNHATNAALSVTIPVDPDGHYYLTGTINGTTVRFLIDTGASTVSISEDLAQKSHVTGGREVEFQTASGKEKARVVEGINLSAGPFSVPGGTTVLVNRGLGNTSLLGQRFLEHFAISMSSGQMIIRTLP